MCLVSRFYNVNCSQKIDYSGFKLKQLKSKDFLKVLLRTYTFS